MSENRVRERFSGVLLHPTSLPGRSGIGDLGDEAHRFIDFLSEARQSLWQVCPLGPTGYGDSPYACFSAFAGNPMLVALEPLAREGLLDQAELDAYPDFPEDRVDYGPVIEAKSRVLRLVGGQFEQRANDELRSAFAGFCEENRSWLDDYTLFMALKHAHWGASWNTWDGPLARHEASALEEARHEHAGEIHTLKVAQFLFFHQWAAIKKHANMHEIRIIGDAPIFVAYDSADVWSQRELFFLDEQGRPEVVAGVPPDYFSSTGQLWGNPLYNWKRMAEDGYRWWMDRLSMALRTADIIRLDHFRGFDAYWEVRGGETTAAGGRWVRGPGESFFDKVREKFGLPLPLIAEDLGVITARVNALRKQFGMPGMKILQFAFGDDSLNPYLPHNHDKQSVVYTGTHDNDTTIGWHKQLDDKTKDNVRRYLWCNGSKIHLDMNRFAMMSHAAMAIMPMQDLLGLGSEARLNTPGRSEGNWQWRVLPEQISHDLASGLRYMTELYGRAPLPPEPPRGPEEPRFDPDQAVEL